jgi:hypothetical protein
MVRILNILLLLIIIIGVYFVTQANTKFEATRSEYARLTAKVGRLPIEDATKVHVLALETEDPLDFAWLVYLPPKFAGEWLWQEWWYQIGTPTGKHAIKVDSAQSDGQKLWNVHTGSSPCGINKESRMEIVRVQFRKINGQYFAWKKFTPYDYWRRVHSDELLHRPGTLNFQQLGKGRVQVLAPDAVSIWLEITQPQDSEVHNPPRCIVRFGSQEAWAKQPSIGN